MLTALRSGARQPGRHLLRKIEEMEGQWLHSDIENHIVRDPTAGYNAVAPPHHLLEAARKADDGGRAVLAVEQLRMCLLQAKQIERNLSEKVEESPELEVISGWASELRARLEKVWND